MMKNVLRYISCFFMSLSLVACGSSNKEIAPYTELSQSASEQREELIQKGADWLASKQLPTGNWGAHEGFLGYAILSTRALHRIDKVKYKTHIKKGLDLVLARQIKEGKNKGAFQSAFTGKYLNYITSLSIMLLNDIDSKKYKKEIKMGQRFVMGLQFKDENREEDFGAIGYGSKIRGDMSNTQYALQALYETGVPKDSPVFQRVKKFLAKTQNPDGGSAYGVGDVNEGKSVKIKVGDDEYHKSYGSMTYALIKCMIYIDLEKGDKSLDAAFNWVTNNYSLDENPGLATVDDPAKGLQGIFYYFHTFAKALRLYGVHKIPLKDGRKADWREDLIHKMAQLQQEEGFWYNNEERWDEKDPTLCTAYALLTLCETR